MAKKTALGYILLVFPLVASILAVTNGNFFFKASVAISCGLIILFTHWNKVDDYSDTWFILTAFVFSVGGDWFLSIRGGRTDFFIYGILLFFIAHIGYFIFALVNGRVNYKMLGILLFFYIVFFIFLIYPAIENIYLLFSVLGYLVLSCLSMSAAAGIDSPFSRFKFLFVFGIMMILLSDTLIALKEFADFNRFNFLILPTYYLAQFGITVSLLSRLRAAK